MPQIRKSELRAGLASGKITEAEIAKLREKGYTVLDDEKTATPQAAATTESTSVEPEKPLLQRIDETAGKVAEAINPVNIATGQIKGALSTAYNVAKGVVNVAQGRPADASRNPDFEAAIQPQNSGERVGQFTERAAEFAAGEGAAARLGVKGTGLIAQGARGAVSAPVVTKAQGGTDAEATTNAAVGALAPVFATVVGGAAVRLGRKIQNSVIRPSVQDVKDGFKIETVEKYGVGGSIDTMAAKTHEAIVERAAALQDELKAANAGGAQVDALKVIADAQADMTANAAQSFGRNKQVAAAFDTLTDELSGISQTGTVDLLTAQQLKRALGQLGAWSNGKGDPASNAMELAANAVYSKLKTAIEAAAPNARIAAINKEIGELIPVERAILRRIPVEARNNALSLGDLFMIGTGNGGAVLFTKGMKSGAVGNATVKAGKAIKESARPATAATQAAVSGQ